MRACSPPPQSVPVGGRLCEFVEGWKHIKNDPFVLSIVAKGYRLRFTSPPLLLQTPWEIRFPIDTEDSGNARADFPNALEEHNLRDISRHPRVLFECIPDTQGIWKVASSYVVLNN